MSREFHRAKVASVAVTVPASGDIDVDGEMLSIALNNLLAKARRFPPDGRFDWSRAQVDWKE